MSKKTLIVFSNDLDKVMAAFIITNGALAMGDEVTMFFTFWGLRLSGKHVRLDDAARRQPPRTVPNEFRRPGSPDDEAYDEE